MKTIRTRRLRRAALFAVSAVSVAATALGASAGSAVASPASSGANPIVRTDGGLVRGAGTAGVDTFLGLPYAAPPTGNLRWRPPQPAAAWSGVRDATTFGPSCPQAPGPFAPPGAFSEDCLYLNVYTPAARSGFGGRPVLVWIHGGGLVQDGARNYDGTKLAADGTVVVTINYRLGALGFLAHPALASRPSGAAGNYGLMDQQAALRWVQRNIARFGGDPHDVTIAGQSAGGLSVLAQLVSPGARGLFQRAHHHDFARLIWHTASPAWRFDDATFKRSAAAFGNPDHVAVVIHNYRWRIGLAAGEPELDMLEQRLAAFPPIAVPTVTLEGDANGAPHPEPADYAARFTGKYLHRILTGGIGHNLPQEAPLDFVHAIEEADSFA